MFKLKDGTMFFPSRLQVGEIKRSPGLTLATPPDDVVEEFAAVVTVPLIEYQFHYGLGENMQVEGGATSIETEKQACAGAKWIFGGGPLYAQEKNSIVCRPAGPLKYVTFLFPFLTSTAPTVPVLGGSWRNLQVIEGCF